jgi:hypothetical protein
MNVIFILYICFKINLAFRFSAKKEYRRGMENEIELCKIFNFENITTFGFKMDISTSVAKQKGI